MTAKKIEPVEVKAQPILCVARTCATEPPAIAETMGSAFHLLGEFIGKNRIVASGAPYAIYRKWDNKEITFDVGFPVSADELAKASGEINAGETPAGRALKAIHNGPYAQLPKSYAAFKAHVKESGMPHPKLTWEVYVSDPDKVPEEELVTELYMALPE